MPLSSCRSTKLYLHIFLKKLFSIKVPPSCCQLSTQSWDPRNPESRFLSFIYGCAGSLLLHAGFLVAKQVTWLRCAVFSLQCLFLLRSTGSRYAGFSSCDSRTLKCELMWRTGLVVPVQRFFRTKDKPMSLALKGDLSHQDTKQPLNQDLRLWAKMQGCSLLIIHNRKISRKKVNVNMMVSI